MPLYRWYFFASILAAVLIVAYYLHYVAGLVPPTLPSGRTPQGLLLGILGFAAMLGALLYSWRRRYLARSMHPIRVAADTRKDLKAREQIAMKGLQALQKKVQGNLRMGLAEVRRQATQILKENKMRRYIRARVTGGSGKPLRLTIERREWAGRLQVWYYWHLMLGLLSILLILTHAGFRFDNVIATLAFLCLVGVVATGIWGYVIYRVVPPALTKVEERVQKTPEELRADLHETNQELHNLLVSVKERKEERKRAHDRKQEETNPGILSAPHPQEESELFEEIYRQEAAIPGVSLEPSWRWFSAPATIERDTARPDRLRLIVKEIPTVEQEDFRKMVKLIFQKEKLEVSLYPQLRYDYLLKIWLSFHIPLTAGLMIFSLIHIISILYY